jgi:formate-dependent nitrite reductase membrane component NrfD
VIYLAAEHFVRAPQWTWYILFYFFFAGIAAGCYVLATILRFGGDLRDEPAARLGFYISVVATLICPILLTADLGVSWSRFWHMLVDVTPGDASLNFKYWSPMSVGVWALLFFGFFAVISALDTWARDRGGRPTGILGAGVGRVFNIAGAILGLFIASYTGVLLTVSNQPVWSDTWALGGLFLASGLSGGAAAITLFVHYRSDAAFSLERLRLADAYFAILELALLIAFFVTVALAGTAGRIVPFFPLWIIVLIGIGASMLGIRRPARVQASGESAAMAPVALEATVVSIVVLLAVLAMRAAVIFSAQ